MTTVTITTPTALQLACDVAALPAVLAALEATPQPAAQKPATPSPKKPAAPEPVAPSPERVRQVAPRIEDMIAAHGPHGVHVTELRKEIRGTFNGGRYADGSRRRDVAEAAVDLLVKSGSVLSHGDRVAVVKNPGPSLGRRRWWQFS